MRLAATPLSSMPSRLAQGIYMRRV